MRGVKVELINPVNPNDSRGPTFEWKFPDGRQITVYKRKKGKEFGGHFHTGEDPSKNPERFFLVSGRMRMKFVNRNGKEKKIVLEPGSVLTIYPHIKHFMKALEDVIIIESRVTHFDRKCPDTYPC